MTEYSKTRLAVIETLRDLLAFAEFESSKSYIFERFLSFFLALAEHAGNNDPNVKTSIIEEISERVFAGVKKEGSLKKAIKELERAKKKVDELLQELKVKEQSLTKKNLEVTLDSMKSLYRELCRLVPEFGSSKIRIAQGIFEQSINVLEGELHVSDYEDHGTCGFVYFAQKLLGQVLELENFKANHPEISSTITELLNISRLK